VRVEIRAHHCTWDWIVFVGHFSLCGQRLVLSVELILLCNTCSCLWHIECWGDASSVKRFFVYDVRRKQVRPTWWVCLKTPTCALFTPSVWPSCRRTYSLPDESVVNVLKLSWCKRLENFCQDLWWTSWCHRIGHCHSVHLHSHLYSIHKAPLQIHCQGLDGNAELHSLWLICVG